jgi:hypothetical protein
LKGIVGINAEPTFDGLKQILNEPDRVFIGAKPQLLQRWKTIQQIHQVSKNPLDCQCSIEDLWFEHFDLELNAALVAIIGNKGNWEKRSYGRDSIGWNTHQDHR